MEDRLKTVIDQMIRSNTSFKNAVSRFKEGYLQKALELSDGNHLKAAEALGLDQDSFRRKIRKYKVATIKSHRPTQNGKSHRKKETSRSDVLYA